MCSCPTNAYNDGDGRSRLTHFSSLSSWMSHPRKRSKHGSLINPHSATFRSEPDSAGSKQKHVLSFMSSDTANFNTGKGKEPEAKATSFLSEKGKNLGAEKSDCELVRSLSLAEEKRNTLTALIGSGSVNTETTSVGARNSSIAMKGDLQPKFGHFSASLRYLEKKGLPLSKSSDENVGSIASAANRSKVVVFGRHFSNDNYQSFSKGKRKCKNYSSVWVHEKRIDLHSTSSLRQNDWDTMEQDSCPKNRPFPSFTKSPNRFQKVQKDINLGMFMKQSSTPKSFHGCRLPDVANEETTGICSTVNSLQSSLGGTPMFLQTTRHFFFSEKRDIRLSKHQQIFQEAKVSNKPNHSFRIESLGSSNDGSAGKDDLSESRTSNVDPRTEALAETNTTTMGASGHNNIITGGASSQPNKDNSRAQSALVTYADTRRQIAWGKSPMAETPNSKTKPSHLPCESNSTDGHESSTSRTQSLDAEHLFTGIEQRSRSKSNQAEEDVSPLTNPSVPWVNRLKRNSAESLGCGTKRSMLDEEESSINGKTKKSKLGDAEEPSTNGKTKKSKLGDAEEPSMNGKTKKFKLDDAEEPSMNGKTKKFKLDDAEDSLMNCKTMKPLIELMISGRARTTGPKEAHDLSDQKAETSSSAKKNRENAALDCPWIQRWCCTSLVKEPGEPDPPIRSVPELYNVPLDDNAKKPFPSVGAMALMGKSMNGLRPTREITRKGPITLWNTKE